MSRWLTFTCLIIYPQSTPSSSTPQSRWPSQVSMWTGCLWRRTSWQFDWRLNASAALQPSVLCGCECAACCWCALLFAQPLGTRRLTSGATWCSFLPPSHHQMSVWVALYCSRLRVFSGMSWNLTDVFLPKKACHEPAQKPWQKRGRRWLKAKQKLFYLNTIIWPWTKHN